MAQLTASRENAPQRRPYGEALGNVPELRYARKLLRFPGLPDVSRLTGWRRTTFTSQDTGIVCCAIGEARARNCLLRSSSAGPEWSPSAPTGWGRS